LYLKETWQGEKISDYVQILIEQLQGDANIKFLINARIQDVEGFVGNFKIPVQTDVETVLEHGVTIIACGAEEFKPDDYLYGLAPQVLTGLELQVKLKADRAFERRPHGGICPMCGIATLYRF
jgi:heterodisulfide reductase subunit A